MQNMLKIMYIALWGICRIFQNSNMQIFDAHQCVFFCCNFQCNIAGFCTFSIRCRTEHVLFTANCRSLELGIHFTEFSPCILHGWHYLHIAKIWEEYTKYTRIAIGIFGMYGILGIFCKESVCCIFFQIIAYFAICLHIVLICVSFPGHGLAQGLRLTTKLDNPILKDEHPWRMRVLITLTLKDEAPPSNPWGGERGSEPRRPS